MKILSRLMILLLAVAMIFAITACNGGGSTDDPNVDPGKQEEPEEQPAEVLLVEDKKANFTVVYTGASGNKAKTLANDLVTLLTNLEATDKQAYGDADADKVQKCEVVIGSDPKNRGEGVASKSTLGEKDWKVELVGYRVFVYGGSDDALESAYNYFVGSVLKISDKSTKISKTIKAEAANFGKSSTLVTSFTVGGANLKDFTLVYDSLSANAYDLRNAAYDVQTKLKTLYGINLPVMASSEANVPTEKIFLLTQTAESGTTGFRLRADGQKLLLEFKYINTFKRVMADFLANELSSFKGDVSYTGSKTVFSLHGNVVTYEDFGAVGDGKNDDFLAIVQTHNSANTYGQKVGARDDATYYIGEIYSDMTAVIRTDVDWGNAHFIIDDRGEKVEANKTVKTFRVENDNWAHTFTKEEMAGKSLKAGAKNVGFTLERDSLLLLENSDAPMFIRWGINNKYSSSMYKTTEVILVDKDGNVDESTPVLYNYDSFTKIVSFPTDSTPITIKGGNFTTYANDARSEYGYYYRGIYVERAHVTVENVNHTIEKEFETGKPYDAFLGATYSTDVEFRNCNLQAHKMYRVYNEYANTMGSYDTQAILANDVRWVNCKQTNLLIDMTYWGIHTSDFTKNLSVEKCEFNRVDAHTGVHNFKAVDTKCGFNINMVGSGDLILTRVTREAGEEFIYFRDDYGSTWNGDVIITDCEHQGYMRGNSDSPMSKYTPGTGSLTLYHTSFLAWDFGYDCYLPQNTTINGLKCGLDGNASITLFAFTGNSVIPSFTSNELIKIAASNPEYRGEGAMNVLHMPKTFVINDMECKTCNVTNDSRILQGFSVTDNRA